MSRPGIRNKKKTSIRLPGGRNKQKIILERPSKALCGECKKELHGVPRYAPSKMKNMPKTAKRPERPYGGTLCSKCTRKMVKMAGSRAHGDVA